MKPAETVLLAWICLAGCATPAREQPVSSTVPAPDASPSRVSGPPAAHPSSVASAAAPAPTVSAAPPSRPATGSAYFGCGQPIPGDRSWDETTESEVLEAISVAKDCAADGGRRLLLEFVAPWCEDCREMARLDETPLVAETLRARFERVRINIGKWDRHEGLRKTYEVKALATYIVIDPKTSKLLAKTTLEPITKKRGKKLTAADWAAWLSQH